MGRAQRVARVEETTAADRIELSADQIALDIAAAFAELNKARAKVMRGNMAGA